MRWIESRFLVERALGAGLYCLVVMVAFLAIRNNRLRLKTILNLVLFTLVVMAFFYIPTETADIYRWQVLSRGWMGMRFKDFVSVIMMRNATPLGVGIIYVCQKTGINGILPAFCALVFYANVFHIFVITEKKYQISPRIMSLVFLYIMCTGRFQEVIAGIRNMLGFSIVARCIADEVIKDKSVIKNAIWYLTACLIHSAIIPLVMLRMLFLLFDKKNKNLGLFVNLGFLMVAILFAYRYGMSYVITMYRKARGFLTYDVYSYFWEYLITILHVPLTIYALWKYYKKRDRESELYVMETWGVVTTVAEILMFGSFAIFQRFAAFSSLITIPVMASVLEGQKENDRVTESNLIIICLITLMIAAVRGNLCAYKFFIL
ncbi:MAG: EpsG family protein [Acetatifactor sp.]|nr:EpsG family protein [Acetatifactor sp.]